MPFAAVRDDPFSWSGLSGDSLVSTTASSKAAPDEAKHRGNRRPHFVGPGAMEGGKAGSLVWKAGAESLPRLFRLLSVDHGQSPLQRRTTV
jgi:hypothetical protein